MTGRLRERLDEDEGPAGRRAYHRPLEVYLGASLGASLGAGLRLAKLADVPDRAGLPWLLPPDRRFPRFTVLPLDKP